MAIGYGLHCLALIVCLTFLIRCTLITAAIFINAINLKTILVFVTKLNKTFSAGQSVLRKPKRETRAQRQKEKRPSCSNNKKSYSRIETNYIFWRFTITYSTKVQHTSAGFLLRSRSLQLRATLNCV